MDALQRLYKITETIDSLFDHEITVENRAETIERLIFLLEERDQYVKNLSPPYSEKERELGKSIVQRNEKIEKKMKKLYQEMKSEFQQLKKQQQSNKTYLNPFQSVQGIEGIYLDQKN